MTRPFTALVAVSLYLTSPAMGAPADETERSREKALQLCAAGRLPEAIDEFAALYARTQDPVVFQNQASCYLTNGDIPRAIARYELFLSAAPNAPAQDRENARAMIRKLKQDLASAQVAKTEQVEAKERLFRLLPTPSAPLPSPPPAAPAVTADAEPSRQVPDSALAISPERSEVAYYRRPAVWVAVAAVAAVGVAVVFVATRGETRRAEVCAPADCAAVAGVVTR